MYTIYHIDIEESLIEQVQALLSLSIQMDGVSYENAGFSFYVNNDHGRATILSHIEALQKQYAFTYSISELEDKNWNAQWESDFKSVEVHNYCRVRAPFHDLDESFTHDIIIHPGMAFGTGHHETTWMMLDNLSRLDINGKRILDAGCGTGVLAILAAKEGANEIEAFDFDIHSFESAQLNKGLNKVEHIKISHSDVSNYTGGEYDVIVANINRNVIISCMQTFSEKLAYKGMIIVSGYLEVDIIKVQDAAAKANLQLTSTNQRGEWICQVYQR